MHIGVDATCWENTRGYGRHSRALLTALVNSDEKNRFTFFTDSLVRMEGLPSTVVVNSIRANEPTVVAASANGHRSARDMWRVAHAMSGAKLDLLFFPTIYSYVPVISRAKKLVMIHDVIAETYPELTMPRMTARLMWKTKVALGRWQADALATVSEYSRRGIVEKFGMDASRVHVVGEAGDPVFRVLENPTLTQHLTLLGLNENQRTIVYVGGFSPHKNLEALVSAFEKLVRQPSFSDVRLVLVGEFRKEVFHSYGETIRKQIESLGLQDLVIWTGYLPDDELVVLLNLAAVSVLPSLIEGFGLPAIEAAACGCPVIATKESPLPSLLGDGGLYIDPARPEQLEDALSRVLSSEMLRREMGEKGREASSRLTWKAAANQLSDVMLKVAAA